MFVERLEFCHTIEVQVRLDAHQVTIALEELLLQKLQIIEMTTTDVIDIGALLATHDVNDAGGDPEAIDGGRIARLLAATGAFTTPPPATCSWCATGPGTPARLRPGSELPGPGAGRLLAAIDAEPKNARWRMRDRIGERKQWWQDVDEKEATY